METNEMKNSVPEEQPGEELNATGNVETPATSEPSAEVSSEQQIADAANLQTDDHHDDSVQDEHVDFSDEEASVASSNLDEEDGDEDDDDAPLTHGTDYSGLSKPELIAKLRDLVEANVASRIRKDIDAIKIAFYKRHKIDVERERKAFIDGGGAAEEFQYTADTYENDLKEFLKQYREKKAQENISQEQEKEKNL